LNIKGPIINIDNRFNKILPSFSPFNHKFSLGNRLIDVFPNCFLFHSLNRKSKNSIKNHLHNFENVTLQALLNPHTVVVVLDASIRNRVATSIVHVYAHDSPIIKTIHHTVNITSTEAELFVIRCGINQAIYLSKRNFDSLLYLYQIYSAAISHKLRKFFE